MRRLPSFAKCVSSKTLDADAPNPGANLHAHSWYVEPASPFSSNSLAAVRVLTRVSSAEDTHFLHHEDTEVGRRMQAACRAVPLFNFMTGEEEIVNMTCAGCTPHICAEGEHECQPIYCADENGDIIGGHTTDPCEGGHHGDDGLAWWPFLLCCLLVTVCVTGLLEKLSNGACFGKSVNPPFTVCMFFFGYAAALLQEWYTEYHADSALPPEVRAPVPAPARPPAQFSLCACIPTTGNPMTSSQLMVRCLCQHQLRRFSTNLPCRVGSRRSDTIPGSWSCWPIPSSRGRPLTPT